MVRFYFRFTGRVQGVGFRFFVAMNAERCHLTGWVKNMSDGSVTAEVQGTRVEIEKFLNLIQTGNRSDGARCARILGTPAPLFNSYLKQVSASRSTRFLRKRKDGLL